MAYVVGLTVGVGAVVGPPKALAAPGEVADLRADVDRNGLVDLTGTTDEAGEDAWTRLRGVIVLPNLDDDARRCPVKKPSGRPLPIAALVRCNDGADTAVNGERDAADLARLRTVALPRLPDQAYGTVALTGPGARHGRLFVKRASGWRMLKPADRLAAQDLRRGIELGLEATDLVRSPHDWNGQLTVRFTVVDGGRVTTDTVVARVAPLLTQHHRQRAERILVTRLKGGLADPYAERQRRFVDELGRQVRAAGITAPLFTFTAYGDVWAQDFVEPAYVSMPGPGGRPQAMRIMLRSAQPTREAGRELWERLRGPDIGAVQVTGVRRNEEGTLNSTGNLETIPPYRLGNADYPAGRIVMGRRPDTGSEPAKAMRDFLTAQGMQRPLLLDTSWLAVGHVDEFLQFLPAPTPRGWRLAVADPEAGLTLLRNLKAEGHGRRRLFSVPSGGGGLKSPTTTIDQALANRRLLQANATAARKIAANVTTLRRETGLTDAEIVRIPGLYAYDSDQANTSRLRKWGQQAFLNKDNAGRPLPGTRRTPQMSAYIPGAINSLLLTPDRVLAARQWGPVIAGKDVFAEAVSTAYRKAGVQAVYIDDWYTYHVGAGEVHCATNTLRTTSTPWWTP